MEGASPMPPVAGALVPTGREEPGRPAQPGRRVGRVLLYAAVAGGALVYALPFLWMISTSIKPDREIFAYPPKWISSEIVTDGYTAPWDNLPFPSYYRQTVTITALNIVGYLASCSLTAFAFARMRFRGRTVLFYVVLATMMLPSQVTIIPQYRFWSELGMINTIVPLTAPALFAGQYSGAFTIFLLRQFMLTIPHDLDDAAKLDGASWLRIYWNIVLPQAGPALGAAAIFLFSAKWSDFLDPLIYLNDPKTFTVPLGLAQLNSRYSLEYQQTMAQTLISLAPVLLVFFVLQRRYVQGIVVSGVKG